MIQARSINLSFGSRMLFDSISFDIKENQKIGLVGANGAGKSTLLEVIAGLHELDSGSISIQKNKKIAYLAQDVVLSSSFTVLQETLTAFEGITRLQNKISVLDAKIIDSATPEDIEEYAHLCQELQELNPELAAAEAKKMLLGLGFKIEDYEKSVTELSIGWRMRIVLAKLLLQKADFYLFDEPTNHLDIFAKDWFLDFLNKSSFGFMLVCHEQYFLDTLCKQILELEHGKGILYQGNYSAYELQKEHNRALLESAYVLQQKEIKQKQDTINRFKASASRAKQAQSMIKQLDKLERIVIAPTNKNIKFSFAPLARSGTIALKVENVEFRFNEAQKPIFAGINFEIERGQKVALVASNGVGKSTLLNLISGKLPLQKGTITFGTNVKYTLFDQDQNAALDSKKTVLENIENHCPRGVTIATIRSFLGAFLFSGDDVNKKIEVLSGGEKNRVGMVRVLLQHSNLLLLDEPTNHLDINAKKVLLEALKKYEGTILFVSHDRDFLNNLATRVIELTPSGILSFMGNYDQYRYYKQQMEATNGQVESDVTSQKELSLKPKLENRYELGKKCRALEKKIDQLEQKIRDQELAFAQLIYGTNAYTEAQDALRLLKEQHDQALKEWELLQS